MPGASSRDRLADQLRDHTSVLSSLDPDAQLDDLEPLREIVGDARVVALGEGCHFVAEFGALRRRVIRFLAERYRVTGRSVAVAAPRWAGLERGEQDRLTALLARLLVRMRALEPLYVSRSDQHRYDLARRHLEAAVHTDYMFGAMNDIFAGHGLPADASVRDAYMASSLRWHLERLEPGTRVVLAAHNAHIQKTPVYYGGELAALPMGHYLAEELGGDYRSIALTHTAESVPEMYPDGSPESGFTVTDTSLDPPSARSVEGALVSCGLGAEPALTDLRPLARRGDGQPDRIRSQSDELELPVATAFDAILSVPTITPEVSSSSTRG